MYRYIAFDEHGRPLFAGDAIQTSEEGDTIVTNGRWLWDTGKPMEAFGFSRMGCLIDRLAPVVIDFGGAWR